MVFQLFFSMSCKIEVLKSIIDNVIGFDLNPLAVLTARVNYLLAISDLLPYQKSKIGIPIYLADSVRIPAQGKDLFSRNTYRFPTVVEEFFVPDTLCTKGRFDTFTNLLEECIKGDFTSESFLKRLLNTIDFDKMEWTEELINRTTNLYKKLSKLHQIQLDGLWARLLKNNFAPITVGQFDYVIGNPPWVNWQNLPDAYRDDIKPIWKRYGLFPHGGLDTILGKGKKDISMLMTYTVCHNLLKNNGKLSFVITQSVLKTTGSGQGFRNFSIPDKKTGIPLRVLHVDDMVKLKPFEGASNRTAVIIIQKGQKTRYPVTYTIWRKIKKGSFTYQSSMEDVVLATKRLNFEAEPIDQADLTSSWMMRPKGLSSIKNVIGESDYVAHAGAYNGGANSVYFVDILEELPNGMVIIKNITDRAKVKVDEVTATIEKDLLYPLLRGRDIKRWNAVPSSLLLMVQDPATRSGIKVEELQKKQPLTYNYLMKFKKILMNRKSRGVSDMIKRGAAFYTMFAIGDYTFSPYKVAWTRVGTDIKGAVCGSKEVLRNVKPIIPIETATLVPFDNLFEANYFCAVLNSTPWRFVIISTNVEGTGGFGSPNVLKKAKIPRFDPNNKIHNQLSKLSMDAHEIAARGDEEILANIEIKIRAYVLKVVMS